MSRAIACILMAAALGAGQPAWAAAHDQVVVQLEGRGDRFNVPFSVDGPWRLVWEVERCGAFGSFELRLTDATSGRPLGIVVQTSKDERDRRTFEYGGRFHLDVLARDVRWTVRVTKIPPVTLSLPDASSAP